MLKSRVVSTLFLLSLIASQSLLAQDFVPGEIIVKIKGKLSSGKSANFLGKMRSEKGMALKASFSQMNIHHFALKPGTSIKATLEELRNDPDVEYAEPNYIIKKVSDGNTPGEMLAMSKEDALAAMSADARTASASYQQSGAHIQATEAWQYSSSSQAKPIVAIVDTGVDISHSVFTESQAIWTNEGEIPNNHVDDDNNGYVDDVHGWNFFANSSHMYDDDGHGTHVAGTVLGVGQDILETHPALSKIKIMPLKFLGADGSGTTTSAIKAIYYAVNNGAQVINNSWGGSSYSASLHEAMTYAYQNGVLLLSAAGNAGKNNDASSMYPANYDVPSNISVAATNDWDSLASFSNFGATTVHVAAPGVSILSTTPDETYSYSSGTSMATPMVSGLAALIWREAPSLTGFQIKSIILDTVEAKSSLQNKLVTKGRVNVLRAIQQTLSLNGSEPFQPLYTASLKASGRSPASESQSSVGGGCGIVKNMTSGDGSGGGLSLSLIVTGLFMVPLAVYRSLRRKTGAQRRRYDRFKMTSEVTVKLGDRELVGSMNSISMGGVSFNADAMLEKGGTVTMHIKSPDGKETIEVSGQVVWNEKNHAYGVQFSETKETALQMISRWSTSLTKI